MTASGGVYVPPGSRVERFAETIAWLWRLGSVQDTPSGLTLGLGGLDELAQLRDLARAGELAGAPSFGPRCRVGGEFYVLDAPGEPIVRSELGVHAVRDDNLMLIGADPDASWGALDAAWALDAIADFAVDILDRPLALLPPVGWVRYDDAPGSAYHQLTGRTKPDTRMRRRIEKAVERFADAGACLNVAIPPRTLIDGRDTPVDEVWPESIAALRGAVRAGYVEPVYHGYLHLDTDAWEEGRISPREFETVRREEAERRLGVASEWFADVFGPGRRTFVAPVWTYSEGLLAALLDRDIPTWLPPDAGPLVVANTVRETLYSTMEGLFGLDYGPYRILAEAGVPPTIVMHGGLFDARIQGLRDRRQPLAAARLFCGATCSGPPGWRACAGSAPASSSTACGPTTGFRWRGRRSPVQTGPNSSFATGPGRERSCSGRRDLVVEPAGIDAAASRIRVGHSLRCARNGDARGRNDRSGGQEWRVPVDTDPCSRSARLCSRPWRWGCFTQARGGPTPPATSTHPQTAATPLRAPPRRRCAVLSS